eukprot:scaffold3243_cov173-Ochromonas_danica.AAC.41
MDLTQEQLDRIEQQRQAALLRLREKEAEKAVDCLLEQDSSCQLSSEPVPQCEQINEEGNQCKRNPIDNSLFESFGVKVCIACRRLTDEFDLVTKADGMANYLIPSDSFQLLRFVTKNNPHNPGWTPMKLFLRKEVKSLAIKRFGSLENILEEKRKREEKKLQRTWKKTEEELGRTRHEYETILRGDDPTEDFAVKGGPKKRRKLLGDVLASIVGQKDERKEERKC